MFSQAQEGLTINKIKFNGNTAFTDAELKLLMELSEKKNIIIRTVSGTSESSRYSEYVLQRDLNRIINFYKTEGYVHAKIDSFHVDFKEENEEEDAGFANIIIYLSQGNPIHIASIEMQLELQDTTYIKNAKQIIDKLKQNIRKLENRRFRDEDLNLAKATIINAFNNRGYPFATIKPLPVLKAEANAVNIKFIVQPGLRILIGEIEIIGNGKVPKSLIRNQLSIATGQTYQAKRIHNSRQQIYNLGMFSVVTIKILTDRLENNRIPVQVIVKEAPRLTTKLGIGWGRDDRFRTYTETTRLGFLGGARRQTLYLKHSYREPITLNWEMIQPAFLHSENNLSVKPFYRRQNEESFKTERVGQTTSLFRIMAKYTRGSLAYTLERVRTQYQDADERYTKSSATINIYRDTSQPLFTPNRGMYSALIYTFSGLGFNSRTFGKIQLEAKRYREIYTNVVLAYKAKAGYGYVYGNNPDFPQEELFYAGGSTSVRGWYRSRLGPTFPGTTKPRGGTNLFEGSMELRFPVWDDFGSVLFLDFGNVWNGKYTDLQRSEETKLHYATGFGVRYLTAIGPIRLDIGKEILNSRGNNPEFAIHISVGQAF